MLIFVCPSLELSNVYGFLALWFYTLSLFPSNASIFLMLDRIPLSLRDRLLFCITRFRQHRRHIGVMCFGFSVAHGLLVLYQHSLQWEINTNPMTMIPHYWHGLTLMTIMTILAVTSNNWCVKVFRQSWHVIHRLTYPMAFLLLYHILWTMRADWSGLTTTNLVLLMSTLIIISYRYFQGYLCCSPKLVAQFRRKKRSKVLTKV